jgi:hypothetical protein
MSSMRRPRYVVEGPRWFRNQIRGKGPFLALGPPLVIGAVSLLLLNAFSTRTTGMTGLVLGFFAAPALPALGAPFSDSSRYPVAIAASVVLWLIVGLISARRATRNPMASWSDYWRTFWWLAAGIWMGTLASLFVATVVLGRSLL